MKINLKVVFDGTEDELNDFVGRLLEHMNVLTVSKMEK